MTKRAMDEFTEKVLNFIRKNNMLTGTETVVVGFSGGADSTALLNVLWDIKDILGIKVYALHVNHGIRKEAFEDESFCQRFCESRGIECKIVSVNVPEMAKELKLTEEEAGRKVRYEAFNEYARDLGAQYIAVAHHENDVAETLLLNLLRGTGLHGGSSIRPVRDNIIRPLLCVSRSEIEEYLAKRDISFCTDKTNLENTHTRNIIRNTIIPAMERDINPRSVEHIARAAASFEKADEFIRDFAKKAYERLVTTDGKELSFDCEELLKEPEVIRQNVILMCFEKLVPGRKDIAAVHVEMVLGLLENLAGTASADLPYGLIAIRSYNKLSIGPKENENGAFDEIPVEVAPGKETQIEIPGFGMATIAEFLYDGKKEPPRETYTKWFDYDRIETVAFRTRKPKDVILLEQEDGLHRKELRKFMTDEKVPQDLRDRMVLLADGEKILWIPGYRMGDNAKVSKDTKRILAIKITNGGNTNG
ncbi:tRNA lysidine(34) synthetase TilS [Butyrivibrio sp. AE2032]|uniref:tRNA lysidine(34) synthetase TilS n=1 Tax=Butyrivibrio sp. AE2032 TaxID=1458463 RepID=UPI00068C3E12|nr:tRNA lysidine(34) synthetase TilS [Butyrivibrio sp. AE2032]